MGLGEMYNDSPDFLARFNGIHPKLAPFQRDAMAHFALTELMDQ
jgi:hypothetical protein